MVTSRIGFIGLLAIALTACATTAAKPESQGAEVIDLSAAVAQIQQTLAEAKMRPNEKKAGLLPSKATVTFVMAAKKSTSAKDGFSIGVALPVGLTLGASGEIDQTSEATASNTIVLEFENALLAPLESVLGQIGDRAKWKSVDDVKDQTEDSEALKLKMALNAALSQ
jgi:hypothetical protein